MAYDEAGHTEWLALGLLLADCCYYYWLKHYLAAALWENGGMGPAPAASGPRAKAVKYAEVAEAGRRAILRGWWAKARESSNLSFGTSVTITNSPDVWILIFGN